MLDPVMWTLPWICMWLSIYLLQRLLFSLSHTSSIHFPITHSTFIFENLILSFLWHSRALEETPVDGKLDLDFRTLAVIPIADQIARLIQIHFQETVVKYFNINHIYLFFYLLLLLFLLFNGLLVIQNAKSIFSYLISSNSFH